jgi:acyl transferase domain-containing protein/acyl carrier protein
MENENNNIRPGLDIAVIGMAGKFPGASNIKEFWENLKQGKETISFFEDEEMVETGVNPRHLELENYVKAKGIFEDIEYFDASFFEYTPREAEKLDPQIRIFHQQVYKALEDAGCDPDRFSGPIGLYGGASNNVFWEVLALMSQKGGANEIFSNVQLTDKDHMNTRISHKLNLTGPSFVLETQCSTSMVGLHLACQGLLSGECDMALAGGISITLPFKSGYFFQEGMLFSPDGHCRAFDKDAKGTVFGNGVGIVVLKRIEEALEDKDYIYAVIKGTAINNDGNKKVSYSAPSIDGQAEVIRTARQIAQVPAESITYVETHGTGTTLGDPIEVKALQLAFETDKKGFCRIGSVKPNVGHLDNAAGITSFIKTVLALQNRMIPPSINYKEPNPKIDFENSPFLVNTELYPWKNEEYPLRAGVSSFGVGGTNVHVILQESPTPPPALKVGGSVEPPDLVERAYTQGLSNAHSSALNVCGADASHAISVISDNKGRGESCILPNNLYSPQLILLSARSEGALERNTHNLKEYLKQENQVTLEEVAYTLQMGRKAFEYRRMMVCNHPAELIEGLEGLNPAKVHTHKIQGENWNVIYLFPGQGAQYIDMGRELYEKEAQFREEMDRCFEILKEFSEINIKEILYPHPPTPEVAPTPVASPAESEHDGRGESCIRPNKSFNIDDTQYTQPLIFVIEYALAQLLLKWGLEPYAMIGHSIGEYVAACISGVISLEQALKLVTLRGQLMQKMPKGDMLMVTLSEEALKPLLDEGLDLAAVNAPGGCVVSGAPALIERFSQKMKTKGHDTRFLHTSHAFHSSMMNPILEDFRKQVREVQFQEPRIQYISNLTGNWITEEEVNDPDYWVNHLRQTVRFSDGITHLLTPENTVFIEVGPGRVLGTLVKKQSKGKTNIKVINLVRHPKEVIPDQTYLLNKLGQMWLYGLKTDWNGYNSGEKKQKIPLPTYSFDRQRFWIDTTQTGFGFAKSERKKSQQKKENLNDWFYIPKWIKTEASEEFPGEISGSCLVFSDEPGLGTALIKELTRKGVAVTEVRRGKDFQGKNEQEFIINPSDSTHYLRLFEELEKTGNLPTRIIHLWSVTETAKDEKSLQQLEEAQETGLYSILEIGDRLVHHQITGKIYLTVVSNDLQRVTGKENQAPEKATLLGAIRTLPVERKNIRTQSIDVQLPLDQGKEKEEIVQAIIKELNLKTEHQEIAYRDGSRYHLTYEPEKIGKPSEQSLLKKKGVYLLTGGLGGIGYAIAEELATRNQARLILVGRTAIPQRENWEQYTSSHDPKDPLQIKIQKIQKLEELGAQVRPIQADISQRDQVEKLLNQAYEEFGRIDGVCHISGIPDQGIPIGKRDREMTRKVLAPKLQGTWILEDLLKEKKLDFFILFSSLGAVLPPPGHVAYVAANAYLDAFAHTKSTEKRSVISINWDMWQEVGIAADTLKEMGQTPEGITIQEGIEVFYRILHYRNPQVVVCTGDLKTKRQIQQALSNLEQTVKKPTAPEETRGQLYERPELDTAYSAPDTHIEKKIAVVLQEQLGIEEVGIYDNFFDLGASSTDVVHVNERLKQIFNKDLPIVTLYTYPTIDSLRNYLEMEGSEIQFTEEEAERLKSKEQKDKDNTGNRRKAIAVIGMAGRFPGAENIEEYWNHLKEGNETVSFFTPQELMEEGVEPQILQNPNYVKAKGVLEDIEYFDATFFDYRPLEAEALDPQTRVFQETVWQSLEDAGYTPFTYNKLIGLYAGATDNLQWRGRVLLSRGEFTGLLLANKDNLCTQTSYKLGLKGPSFVLNTACSTSLIAVHLACQAIMNGECDIAVAGGVSVTLPKKTGYLYQEGMMHSQDGHCWVFDSRANGTVFGNGVGVLVLKNLEQAIQDQDHVYAVVKGSAINNDGERKIGFTAPSTLGQAEVIRAALQNAEVEPESIGYIETHGTGTQLGDPIEIEALKLAFGTPHKQICAIGSVKANIGHLEAAAGAASLIKTILSIHHKVLPPSINYEQPNPKIDFENSPFYVNTKLNEWSREKGPLRAGVSSFGFGGTNAHIILEEAPTHPPHLDVNRDATTSTGSFVVGQDQCRGEVPSPIEDSYFPIDEGGQPRDLRHQAQITPKGSSELLLLSARSQASLEKMTENLGTFLKKKPEMNVSAAAFTLQEGRRGFPYRRAIVGSNVEEIAGIISAKDPQKIQTLHLPDEERHKKVVFLFPGQGAQYVNMGLGLYQTQRVFRETVDTCIEFIKPQVKVHLRDILYPGDFENETGVEDVINQTEITQPVIFIIEYALAQLLMHKGIKPDYMIGHSIGEYAAACISGVLSLEDALKLVVLRGQLMQKLPHGSMLSVALPEKEITLFFKEGISLAAVNSPFHSVISGTDESIEGIQKELEEKGHQTTRLHTSHAFHSPMMEPMLEEFEAAVRDITFQPPRVPYISNLNGDWITFQQVSDPLYWTQHVRNTVRFSEGLSRIFEKGKSIFIETGPGRVLGTFLRKHADKAKEQTVVSLIRHPKEEVEDDTFLMQKFGQLWMNGVRIIWDHFHNKEDRKRISLPVYAFDRQRFWIDGIPQGRMPNMAGKLNQLGKKEKIEDWFYLPHWETQELKEIRDTRQGKTNGNWLIFTDQLGLGAELERIIARENPQNRTVTVSIGETFRKISEKDYSINPTEAHHYRELFKELRETENLPVTILHLWNVTHQKEQTLMENYQASQDHGLYSLLEIVRVLGELGINQKVQLEVVTNCLHKIEETDQVHPLKSTILGAVRTIPKEYPNITIRSIDIELPGIEKKEQPKWVDPVYEEITNTTPDRIVALRGNNRKVLTYEPTKLEAKTGEPPVFKEGGVYLITGGLGGIGLSIAQHLAKEFRAKLVLTGRTSFPLKEKWEEWIQEHPNGNPVNQKIRQLQGMCHQGAEVLTLMADVTDLTQMETIVQEIRKQFGKINGLIHAAGIADFAGVIQGRTRQEDEEILGPKLKGTLILDQLLRDEKPDFILLSSSLSSIMAPIGEVGYCAANSFLDTYANYKHQESATVISVNWDAWQEAGMAVESLKNSLGEKSEQETKLKKLLKDAINTTEGIEVITRILQYKHPQVVVSTGDLGGRVTYMENRGIGQPTRKHTQAKGEVRNLYQRPELSTAYEAPYSEEEKVLAQVWQQHLGLEQIGIHDNFFDLGANSLDILEVNKELKKIYDRDIPLVTFYTYPTIEALKGYLNQEQGITFSEEEQERLKPKETQKKSIDKQEESLHHSIAIIGMSGRFPGAGNIEEFWENLKQGRETISTFTSEDLEESGIDPKVLGNSRYVPVRGVLKDIEYFDAAFFDYKPMEAEALDPQIRVFQETAWEALEHAGYTSFTYKKLIGLYAGASDNIYWRGRVLLSGGNFNEVLLSNKDIMCTQVSYKLNLKGPSFSIQTACSTSLIGVHLACQGLMNNECDLALAGGVSIALPQKGGYFYEDGMISSPDGHCRPFDTQANGTVFSNGVGVVVLKNLNQAQDDGDYIHAIIRGTAINNDGERKVGFTAPSTKGQAEVIRAALQVARVSPESITYVETHGTGTNVGDPIEIEALKLAYNTHKKNYCPIGSVKANIGHLDAAAGVVSLIKTVLAMTHQQLPPSIHFHEPNPKAGFQDSPFYVNTTLRDWKNGDQPLRAGVSSFGFGGTNAHVILEEAPTHPPNISEGRGESCIRPNNSELLLLSAKTPESLGKMTENLAHYFNKNPGIRLPDAAYTLQVGRRMLPHRRMLVCNDIKEAAAHLSPLNPAKVKTTALKEELGEPKVVFMFPGQGSQYVNMGLELYKTERNFREIVDYCFDIIDQLGILNIDLKEILYPTLTPALNINDTRVTQPLIFIFEYALAQLLMKYGVQPNAMIGHSIGEYTAATLSGVLPLEAALKLVVLRGQLMGKVPEGSMLSVSLSEEEVAPFLTEEISLAAINAPNLCVVSGSVELINSLLEKLEEKGIKASLLHTSHAFHSRMMEPILEEFRTRLKETQFKEPMAPYISNLTGDWIAVEQAKDPEYWVQHLRETVRFSQGLTRIMEEERTVFVEIGPGRVLSTLVRKQEAIKSGHRVLNLIRHPHEGIPDTQYLLDKIGQLWLNGVAINWERNLTGKKRNRIPLPTYAFDRQYYWKEQTAGEIGATLFAGKASTEQKQSIKDWFYIPHWQPSVLKDDQDPSAIEAEQWLIWKDETGLGDHFKEHLTKKGQQVVTITPGKEYHKISENEYQVNPQHSEHIDLLFKELKETQQAPDRIIYLWGLTGKKDIRKSLDTRVRKMQTEGLNSLLSMAQAIGTHIASKQLNLYVVTDGLQAVYEKEQKYPEKALLMGPVKVIPREYPNIKSTSIDIELLEMASEALETLLHQLWQETRQEPKGTEVVYSKGERYIKTYEPKQIKAQEQEQLPLRQKGVYLITGGMGGVGYLLAEDLAKKIEARLILIGRSTIPEREKWEKWLETHDNKDITSQKIQKLQKLEELGAEAQYVEAEISDKQQVSEAINRAKEKWGGINGVFHCAGIADYAGIIQGRKPQDTHEVMLPKVYGTLALEKALKPLGIDFLFLFSSIGSIAGPFGEVGYCTANCFLDAYAHYRTAKGDKVTAINWDAWQEAGMAVDSLNRKQGKQNRLSKSQQLKDAIPSSEGLEALYRILGTDLPQVVVTRKALTQKSETEGFAGLKKATAPRKLYQRPELGTDYVPPDTEIEKQLAEIWQEHLGIEKVGIYDNFFDLGANSMDILQINKKIMKILQKEIPVVTFYTYPTIESLTQHLSQGEEIGFSTEETERLKTKTENEIKKKQGRGNRKIAVIGMAGRFPGARNINEFWENLKQGKETITHFTDQELEEAGVNPKLRAKPNYIRAKGYIQKVEYFDAEFFDYKPIEAEALEPQIRILGECVWEALEYAGYDPLNYNKLIGLYAGASDNIYWREKVVLSGGLYSEVMLSNKDILCTQISYKLNLKGPSFSLQTACSTSLIAVHLACQALINGECDMALAGGVSISLPSKSGYLYEEGMIYSPDAHCRAFDAKANGTVFSNGAGIVVLKPLEQAQADHDTIHAVILGGAINNDGERKVGFTAPSTKGQAEVIRAAIHVADVESESISYVETHGTGTNLGDPIEIEALKMAFNTPKRHYCKIGSVKTNIGHLDAAAGIASLIKTVLTLNHQLIPPSLHFKEPNPKIDFENSPFIVNTELAGWTNEQYPLRAGVSSFGFGGTNAHMILEQAPTHTPSKNESCIRPNNSELLVLSAITSDSLDKMTQNLASYLADKPGISLPNVAYTLQVGRRNCRNRRMLVCSEIKEAIEGLRTIDPSKVKTYTLKEEKQKPGIVFMFPGQGAQYVNMGQELYQEHQLFREIVDYCCDISEQLGILNINIKEILYPTLSPTLNGEGADTSPEISKGRGESCIRPKDSKSDPDKGKTLTINDTQVTQPMIFIFQYALAQLLIEWGIMPHAMIGHSIGEYTAACLSGVLTLEDALKLISLRGKLMGAIPGGAMLGVPLPEEELKSLLTEGISLAAHNAPSLCVVSGTYESMEAFEKKLQEKGLEGQRLHTSHAFHSEMMEPVLQEFEEQVKKVTLNSPTIKYISNLTGTWIHKEQLQDPVYWTQHLRNTVRFSEGITELLKEEKNIYVEIGPGRVLSTLVSKHRESREPIAFNLVRHPHENTPDNKYLLDKLGQLWLRGVKTDWKRYHDHEYRKRIPLPTYSFDKKRYWITDNPQARIQMIRKKRAQLNKKTDIKEWKYIPIWKQSHMETRKKGSPEEITWILFVDNSGIGKHVIEELEKRGQKYLEVKPGPAYHIEKPGEIFIRPSESADYTALIKEIPTEAGKSIRILHLWGVTKEKGESSEEERFQQAQQMGYYSLIYLAQAFGKDQKDRKIQVNAVTSHMHEIIGEEQMNPGKSTILGPVKVIPQEYPNIRTRSIDIENLSAAKPQHKRQVLQLLREVEAPFSDTSDTIVALRRNHRWIRSFEKRETEDIPIEETRLREKGVYLITGGLGNIGLSLAEYLATEYSARLVLTGRTPFPAKEEWETIIAKHSPEDRVNQKIRKLKDMEEKGAEILVLTADVTDQEQMEIVVRETEATFGELNGVIHSAGVLNQEAFESIKDITREKTEQQFKSKVYGIMTLEKVLKKKELDFCMIMSSLSSVLGGIGYTTYSTANIYMDHFVQQHNLKNGHSWMSINWDTWKKGEKGKEKTAKSSETTEMSMTPEEGCQVFQQLLTIENMGQVVISTADLEARINRWLKVENLWGNKDKTKKDRTTTYTRPELPNPFEAPGNKLEQELAEIWRGFFRIDKLGVYDNLFDLGATSLDIIQLNRLQKEQLGKDVTVVTMFRYPTVSSLAEYLTTLESGETGQDPEKDRTQEKQKGIKSMQSRLQMRKQRGN